MKQYIVLAFAIILALNSFAQVPDDSVKVRFPLSQWQFEADLDGNAQKMDAFIDSVAAAVQQHTLRSVVIRAYASPEGADGFNQRLTANRCATVSAMLVSRAGVDPACIESYPQGVAWAQLRSAVAECSDVPYKNQILKILDNTPLQVYDSNRRLVSGRKKQLMDLAGGRAWKWLERNIFPSLRKAVAVAYCSAPSENTNQSLDSQNDNQNTANTPNTSNNTNAHNHVYIELTEDDQIVDSNSSDQGTSSLSSDANSLNAGSGTSLNGADAASAADYAGSAADGSTRQMLALKTNMLYYGILLPNLELEWLINDRWSVALEGNLAHWGSYKHDKSYRLAIIDAEVRRWFKTRGPWHGMYVGLIAGGGWFDLLKNTPGHRGEGLMAGASFGYMWPISRTFSLEAEAGLGYVYAHYKDYEPFEGHHVYQRTKDLNYFGPIKLKFSIVWRFLNTKPRKLPQQAL